MCDNQTYRNPKFLFLTSCLKDTRQTLTIQCHCILNTEMVEESIRLELDTKISSNHESTNMTTNNLVSAFDWAVLMRGISSSRMDFISMLGKDVDNIRIRIKLTALDHEDIFVF